jgi:hypothetical protein
MGKSMQPSLCGKMIPQAGNCQDVYDCTPGFGIVLKCFENYLGLYSSF